MAAFHLERTLGQRTRRCEIRSGAALRGAQLVRTRMAHVRTTISLRGKEPIKTMAYELVFTAKIGRFASKFKGLG
jgi:hypothetical protein